MACATVFTERAEPAAAYEEPHWLPLTDVHAGLKNSLKLGLGMFSFPNIKNWAMRPAWGGGGVVA